MHHRVWFVCSALASSGAVALAAIGCGSSTAPLTGCAGPLTADVAFDQTRTPRFSWSPACGISSLRVLGADSTEVWAISVPETQPLAPGISYGEAPSRATVRAAARPLDFGATYRVDIAYVVGGDGLAAHAAADFTVPWSPD